MKVFITKYALTQGIYEANVEKTSPPNMFKTGSPLFHAGEWYESIDEAMAHAENMRERRIKSLERSFEKMRKSAVKVKLLAPVSKLPQRGE